MRLARSAAINMVSVAVTALAGAIAIATLARLLNVQEFGRVVLLLTVANAVAIFEGLRPVVVYEVASGRRPWGEIFTGARRISIASGAVLGVAATGLSYLLPALGFSVAEALVTGCMVGAFFLAVLFWSFLDADGETAFSGSIRGVAWVGVYSGFVALAMLGAPFVAYMFVLALMNSGLAISYMLRLRRRRSMPRAGEFDGRAAARALLRPAVQNIATNVSAVTISVSDRFVIGAILGSAAAGFYSGPSEFATKPAAFLRAIAQVMYPAAARIATTPGAIDAAWRRLTSLALLAAFSGTTVVLFWRVPIVELLLGQQFRIAADVFGILSAAFTLSVAGYAAVTYLNAHGDFVTQRTLYAIAAVVMVTGALLVAPRWGIVGVAWTYATARLVDLALCGKVAWTQGRGVAMGFMLLFALGTLTYALAWWGQALAATIGLLVTWMVGLFHVGPGRSVAHVIPG